MTQTGHVQEHSGVLASAGVLCKGVRFAEGAHCNLLREKPDEYLAHVKAFLAEAEVLHGQTGQNVQSDEEAL
jgi:hypothetical protein